MSTAADEILARYNKTEIETDAFGRAITVKRLRPSQQIAIMRMADSEQQTPVNVMTIAAAVTKIDDAPFSFPRNMGEMNAVLDVLDQEGLTAATKAYMRIQGGAEGTPVDMATSVGNSSGAAS